MSTILCFSVNMGCCVYINEEKKYDFSKWLQYNRVKNLRGSEYFPYPLYVLQKKDNQIALERQNVQFWGEPSL